MVELRSIVTVMNLLVNGVNTHVDVPFCPIIRWTHTLGSYDPSFILMGEMGSGIKGWGWVAPRQKNYFRMVSAEQLKARVTPKQATPFLVDKLTQLSLYLQRQLEKSSTPIQRFRLILKRFSSVVTDQVIWVT